MYEKIEELSVALEKVGYNDILFLNWKQAKEVLTEKRLEMLHTIADRKIESIRDLARNLDRNESTVFKDLKVLHQWGAIDFKKIKNRKIPVLRHTSIIVTPVEIGGDSNG